MFECVFLITIYHLYCESILKSNHYFSLLEFHAVYFHCLLQINSHCNSVKQNRSSILCSQSKSFIPFMKISKNKDTWNLISHRTLILYCMKTFTTRYALRLGGGQSMSKKPIDQDQVIPNNLLI